jgi:septal ring factor EnvC (AmiA/AmiB activator)
MPRKSEIEIAKLKSKLRAVRKQARELTASLKAQTEELNHKNDLLKQFELNEKEIKEFKGEPNVGTTSGG